MAKAFEITLTTAEVIYAASTAEMVAMLAEINGGKAPRFTVKKDELGLGIMKKGKKFSAKMAGEVGATIKVVEHDFTVVVVKREDKPKATGGWLKNAVDFIKAHPAFSTATAGILSGEKRHWITLDGEKVFWTFKSERANLIYSRLTN